MTMKPVSWLFISKVELLSKMLSHNKRFYIVFALHYFFKNLLYETNFIMFTKNINFDKPFFIFVRTKIKLLKNQLIIYIFVQTKIKLVKNQLIKGDYE